MLIEKKNEQIQTQRNEIQKLKEDCDKKTLKVKNLTLKLNRLQQVRMFIENVTMM